MAIAATIKVDSGGCHVNDGRGGGRSRRGQLTRKHPCKPGTLLLMVATKVLATSVTDKTADMLAAAVAMFAWLPSGGSNGSGGWGVWGYGGLA